VALRYFTINVQVQAQETKTEKSDRFPTRKITRNNLKLTGRAGVGIWNCVVHREREIFDSPKGKELLSEWGLPDTLRGVGSIALGYPGAPAERPVKRKDG
jgi:hypothetical protein